MVRHRPPLFHPYEGIKAWNRSAMNWLMPAYRHVMDNCAPVACGLLL
jgi:hypothetical protein